VFGIEQRARSCHVKMSLIAQCKVREEVETRYEYEYERGEDA